MPAENKQSAEGGFPFSTGTGYRQIGQEIYVDLILQCGTVAITATLAIGHAKAFAKAIRECAEIAEVQVIKPPSMLS
jgi:hypothetical protein